VHHFIDQEIARGRMQQIHRDAQRHHAVRRARAHAPADRAGVRARLLAALGLHPVSLERPRPPARRAQPAAPVRVRQVHTRDLDGPRAA
jgi:hypothetical protein